MTETIERNHVVELFDTKTKDQCSVIADRVEFDDYYIRIIGSDPYNYPEHFQETRDETYTWTSKNLTLHIRHDDKVDVIGIIQTDEEVPQPEPEY